MKEYILQGKIFTADRENLFVEAIAVKDGKIVCSGSLENAKIALPGAEVIKKDGFIMPGITEGHAHVTQSTELLSGCDIYHIDTVEKYLEKIKTFINENPDDKYVMGAGYDNGVFDENGPTARMLDSVCADKPVVMMASDHHSRWMNTKALEMSGITKDTPNPFSGEIVRDKNGNATGWLKEAAMSYSVPALCPLTVDDYCEAILFYQDIALSYGITNVFEPMYDCRRDYFVRAMAYKKLEDEGKLKLNVTLGYTIEGSDGDGAKCFAEMEKIRDILKGYKKVRLTTTKMFVDGVIECHTAYLRDDYADAPGDRGYPIYTREQMKNLCVESLERGFDIHTHVIGDAASDMAIDSYEYAQNKYSEKHGRADFRNALTHVQIIRPDQFDRIADNKIIAVTNPYWHFFDPVYYDELEKPFLGAERAAREYPMNSFLKRGTVISQATDYPVTFPPKTMDSLHLMVNRTSPSEEQLDPLGADERISIDDALIVLTYGGAYQTRFEKSKGTLTEGKDADFIVLDINPYETEKHDLWKCKINRTYISGECVYNRG